LGIFIKEFMIDVISRRCGEGHSWRFFIFKTSDGEEMLVRLGVLDYVKITNFFERLS